MNEPTHRDLKTLSHGLLAGRQRTNIRVCSAHLVNRPNAFTFMELLVVMAIIGILSGIAVPRYARFVAGQRADATARRIVTDLTYAQRHAKATSQSRTVVFSTLTHVYTLGGVENPDHTDLPYQIRLGDEPYNATIVSADFGGDAKLTFDGYGVPEDGTVVIRVGGFERTITVGADTGSIIELPIGEKVN